MEKSTPGKSRNSVYMYECLVKAKTATLFSFMSSLLYSSTYIGVEEMMEDWVMAIMDGNMYHELHKV
jgi:hypothetical protein